jgi:hypothetical protein
MMFARRWQEVQIVEMTQESAASSSDSVGSTKVKRLRTAGLIDL